MPMVGGKEYPYTEEGKKAAKKAALKNYMYSLKNKKESKPKKKQNFSGVASQIYS
jgi:hypothetical protein